MATDAKSQMINPRKSLLNVPNFSVKHKVRSLVESESRVKVLDL